MIGQFVKRKEIALLADDLAEGYSAEEALGRLWQRRDGAIDTVEGVRAFGAHNPRDVLTNSVDNRHTTQWRTTE